MCIKCTLIINGVIAEEKKKEKQMCAKCKLIMLEIMAEYKKQEKEKAKTTENQN